MKNQFVRITLLLFLLSTASLKSQWAELGSGISADSDRVIYSIYAVDENIIWGITGFNSDGPVFEFTRTTDGGTTWQDGILQVDPTFYIYEIFALDGEIAWITTSDESDLVSGKVYKTIDGGLTWMEQSTAFSNVNETPVAIHFWDADQGVSFGARWCSDLEHPLTIYTTNDGGNNWSKVAVDDMPMQEADEGLCIQSGNGHYAVVGDTIWFVTTINRVFRSTNQGQSWTATDPIFDGSNAVSLDFRDALRGIVVGIFSNTAARTNDGGISWTEIDIPDSPQAGQIEYIPGTNGTYLVHNGIRNGPALTLMLEDDGDSWEYIFSITNIVCMHFLSPTIGFGGAEINSAKSGGLYRWDNLTLDTEDISSEPHSFHIIPNPVADHLQLNITNINSAFDVFIYDIRGKQLKKEVVNNQHISVTDLQSGCYLIKAVVSDRVYTKTFIKQ